MKTIEIKITLDVDEKTDKIMWSGVEASISCEHSTARIEDWSTIEYYIKKCLEHRSSRK